MVNMKPKVRAALETIKDASVFFYYPDSFKKLPSISFFEASNTIGASGDDCEYASAIEFIVDVWAKKGCGTSEIASAVNEAMNRIGFSRTFAADVHDPDSDILHYSMRFRTLKKN